MSDRLGPNARVLVIGASGAIGQACAIAAGNQFGMMNVTMLSRAADGLDITDETSIIEHLGGLSGPFDLILIATGGLEIGGHAPEKSIQHSSADAYTHQFALNAIAPALILKHLPPLVANDTPAVIATLSARVGSITDNRLGGWISYRAAKAALNQIIRTSAIEYRRTHPKAICVAIHPGTVRSALTRKYVGNNPSVAPQEAAQNILNVIAGLTPKQNGGFFDWKGDVVEW